MESKFIHSYTPTLDSLIHGNHKKQSLDTIDSLTAVGVIEVPVNLGAWPKLFSVGKELNTVATQFGNQTQQLKDSQATINNVMKAMESSAWLHFACHGNQDPNNPLKSSLMLYDGKLELSNILDSDLPKAKFVYLSACETAMGDNDLPNEAMHLAGGFIAAGFQGAIGTLWSMADAHGPRVAEIVYKTIVEKNGVPDVKMAAKGLHLAIQKLRREGAPLHQWMPFIHLGI